MHIPEIVFSSAATQAFNIFQNASLKLKESKKRKKKEATKTDSWMDVEWTIWKVLGKETAALDNVNAPTLGEKFSVAEAELWGEDCQKFS